MFRKLVIYYLTGTGNALKAARWFEDLAQARGMTAVLIPIDRFRRPIAPPPSEDTLVGFLFPTHGFCLPWYMLKFMLAFPRGRNRLFCLNTYAGTTLGRIALPGLSGLALILPAIVMSLKGYRVRGLVSLNLPSNWISLHPGLTDHAVSVLVEHCKKKTGKYAEALFSGGRARCRGLYPSRSISRFRRSLSDTFLWPLLAGKDVHGQLGLRRVRDLREQLPHERAGHEKRAALLDLPLRELHALHQHLPQKSDTGILRIHGGERILALRGALPGRSYARRAVQ